MTRRVQLQHPRRGRQVARVEANELVLAESPCPEFEQGRGTASEKSMDLEERMETAGGMKTIALDVFFQNRQVVGIPKSQIGKFLAQ